MHSSPASILADDFRSSLTPEKASPGTVIWIHAAEARPWCDLPPNQYVLVNELYGSTMCHTTTSLRHGLLQNVSMGRQREQCQAFRYMSYFK